MRISLAPLPFEEAFQFFEKKGLVLSPGSWRDLWERANTHAFTVARVTAVDVLEDIRDAVSRAIEEGVSLGEFQKSLSEILDRKGWFSWKGEDAEVTFPDGTVRKRLTPWRLETIYRTNVQSAYATGRYRQMLEVAERRPFWMYDAVGDRRTRPSHAAMDGKVYRFDHPFWDRWYPPNGFNCRCTVRTMSPDELDRSALQESTTGVDLSPDAGFAYNPGREAWKPDFNKYSPQGRALIEEILEAVEEMP